VGFKPLEDHVLVNSMNTHGDDVVALEAIKKSDLATRMVKKERGPLQNITNTAAVAHRSTHVGVKAELQEPRTSMPLSVLRSSRPAIVPNGAPQSSQNTQLVSMHELAWIDFNCERRDLLRRVKFRSTAEEVKEMNDTILAEWLQLKDVRTSSDLHQPPRDSGGITTMSSTGKSTLVLTHTEASKPRKPFSTNALHVG
jgi:hypothetical protein